MANIKEKMIKSFLVTNGTRAVETIMSLREDIVACQRIKDMEDIDKELEGLTPRKVIESISQGDFYLSHKYFYKDGDDIIHSADSSRVWSIIRDNIDGISASIARMSEEKYTKQLKEAVREAEVIEKEIAEQREQNKKKKAKINVPMPTSGEYDDYTEVRAIG